MLSIGVWDSMPRCGMLAHFVARAVAAADAFHRRTSCVRRQFWVDIRARNGRLHRMCCTPATDTFCLFYSYAQIARRRFGRT